MQMISDSGLWVLLFLYVFHKFEIISKLIYMLVWKAFQDEFWGDKGTVQNHVYIMLLLNNIPSLRCAKDTQTMFDSVGSWGTG